MRRCLLSVAIVVSLATPASDATVAWIKGHAIPLKTAEAESGFDDLQPIRDVIGDARIVSLGESGSRQLVLSHLRRRLVRLVTKSNCEWHLDLGQRLVELIGRIRDWNRLAE